MLFLPAVHVLRHRAKSFMCVGGGAAARRCARRAGAVWAVCVGARDSALIEGAEPSSLVPHADTEETRQF